MTYKARQGIAMIRISGVNILVPTRQAAADFPHTRVLSLPEALVWRGLEKGMALEKIGEACNLFLRRPKAEASAYVEETIRKLADKGFLIEDGETGHDES